ncbi:MAG: hypothetical protein NVSMB6_16880 [Burkholderiaceae bacterium]
MHAKTAGFIIASRNDAALISAPSNSNRLSFKTRIVADFHCGIKTIAVTMNDLAGLRAHASVGRFTLNTVFYSIKKAKQD